LLGLLLLLFDALALLVARAEDQRRGGTGGRELDLEPGDASAGKRDGGVNGTFALCRGSRLQGETQRGDIAG